ncbi:MAG: bifunctional phosphoribosylaminoimidazolecarboxamide formyltransferase/IMP cyclohydrolase [Oligoflexia bacterium]|nr:bifunctional phosphoribosylaminoimidazolecarboxamide formyltransferase/IMP cyclohydrolase [Oligoflexia bacterium]
MSLAERRIRRALLTVSDKTGIVELASALYRNGTELIATGRTAAVLKEAGLPITPIETVSGAPEAFQGRMKTLSFPVCSGILYRRGDAADEADLRRLGLGPIDCVVVNFYPFESAAAREGISRMELIEEIDIGGPTLVRAAAKNAPATLVLTSPAQYEAVIAELMRAGSVSTARATACAAEAWDRVVAYDQAIARELGARPRRKLRYGENPHQEAWLEIDPAGPIAWPGGAEPALTPAELSYNNILDVAAAYGLASDLLGLGHGRSTGVVIVKHNNPCGVALVPKAVPGAQKIALAKAWEGDPVSAFGGVLVFTDPLERETADWLAERFVELVAALELRAGCEALSTLLARRKNLKAVAIRRFGELPTRTALAVPGGMLEQETDVGLAEILDSVTKLPLPEDGEPLARFGIAVCRALKSNAVALVRAIPGLAGGYQLVGAGQGQPNRIEALQALAIPRAQAVLREGGGRLGDCLLVSDAFFPFRDTVDAAHAAGIRMIVQPGGSIKDAESIAACDEHGIAMAFTGVRHFRH